VTTGESSAFDIHDLEHRAADLAKMDAEFKAVMAASAPFPDFADDPDARTWFDHYVKILSDAQGGSAWHAWRFDHDTSGDLYSFARDLASRVVPSDDMEPAQKRVAEQLHRELVDYSVCCDFFVDYFDPAVKEGFYTSFAALQAAENRAMADAIVKLQSEVDAKATTSLQISDVLDLVGAVLGVVTLGAGKIPKAAIGATKAVSGLIRELAKDARKVASQNPGNSEDMDDIFFTFAQLENVLSRIRKRILDGGTETWRSLLADWGRLEAFTEGEKGYLEDGVPVTHARDVANTIFVGWGVCMWKTMLWKVYDVAFFDKKKEHGSNVYSCYANGWVFDGVFVAANDGEMQAAVEKIFTEPGVLYVYFYSRGGGKYAYVTYRLRSKVSGKAMDSVTWRSLTSDYGFVSQDFCWPNITRGDDVAPASMMGPSGSYLVPESWVLSLSKSGSQVLGRKPWKDGRRATELVEDGHAPRWRIFVITTAGAEPGLYSGTHSFQGVLSSGPDWALGMSRLRAAYCDPKGDKGENVYFLGDGQFTKYDGEYRRLPQPIDPRPKGTGNYPGMWVRGMCAAAVNGQDKAFVFKDTEDGLMVIQYNIAKSRVDKGVYGKDPEQFVYPAAETFPDLLFGVRDRSRPLEAAVYMRGTIYFFSGDRFQSYPAPDHLGQKKKIQETKGEHHDRGVKIVDNFKGLKGGFEKGGWDAAWVTKKENHGRRLYVCKGSEYVRFDDVDKATIGSGGHINLEVSTKGKYPTTMARTLDDPMWGWVLRLPDEYPE